MGCGKVLNGLQPKWLRMHASRPYGTALCGLCRPDLLTNWSCKTQMQMHMRSSQLTGGEHHMEQPAGSAVVNANGLDSEGPLWMLPDLLLEALRAAVPAGQADRNCSTSLNQSQARHAWGVCVPYHIWHSTLIHVMRHHHHCLWATTAKP